MLHAMFKVCGSCTPHGLENPRTCCRLDLLTPQPYILRKSFAMSGTFTYNHFSASGEFLNAKGLARPFCCASC